jgi:hypothetical protein
VIVHLDESGAILRIPVYRGARLFTWALVDEMDYPLAIQWRWTAAIKNHLGEDQYAMTWDAEAKRSILMHRMIMGRVRGDRTVVDHKNGNGFDNTRSNLRVCTQAQNMQNQRKRCGTTSRFRGVTRRRGRWIAQAKLAGEVHYLGTYDLEEQAAEVSAAFRAEHYTHNDRERAEL